VQRRSEKAQVAITVRLTRPDAEYRASLNTTTLRLSAEHVSQPQGGPVSRDTPAVRLAWKPSEQCRTCRAFRDRVLRPDRLLLQHSARPTSERLSAIVITAA